MLLTYTFNALQDLTGSASISTDPSGKHVKLDHSALAEALPTACVSRYHGESQRKQTKNL
jgi:hypothetical protein